MTNPDPSSVRYPGPWEHLDVRANGIRLHAAEYRPGDAAPSPDRPLVVFLHGFGGLWWSWRHLMPQLHTAGHRAVAVDLRGYGDSDKPPRGYDGWTLAGDVNGLIRALGHTTAAVVGHAEGGLGCWATATLHPRTVSAICVISSPHPIALKRSALRNREQRSAMLGPITFAQLPRIAEDRLTRDDGAAIETIMADRSAPQWRRTADYADAVRRYRGAIGIPGTAHSALEYARWAWRSQFRPDGSRFLSSMNQRLHIPVLAFRGESDPYVLPQPMYSSHDWATDFRMRPVEDAGHYAHEEAPDTVGPQLVHFLAGLPGPRLLP
ncbi:alpha/beta hydrolase [Tsukamurella serpentis]